MKTGLQANLFNFSVIARARSLFGSTLLRGCILLFARVKEIDLFFAELPFFSRLSVIPRVGREERIRSGLTARKMFAGCRGV